jgi:hypothetical protein
MCAHPTQDNLKRKKSNQFYPLVPSIKSVIEYAFLSTSISSSIFGAKFNLLPQSSRKSFPIEYVSNLFSLLKFSARIPYPVLFNIFVFTRAQSKALPMLIVIRINWLEKKNSELRAVVHRHPFFFGKIG